MTPPPPKKCCYNEAPNENVCVDVPHEANLSEVVFKAIPDGIENQFVNIPNLDFELSLHPDRNTVDRILHGLKSGFDIGFRGPFVETFPRNNASSRRYEKLLTKSVQKEVERGHTAGPFPHPPPIREGSEISTGPFIM